MDEIDATEKLLFALIDDIPVVTTSWLEGLAELRGSDGAHTAPRLLRAAAAAHAFPLGAAEEEWFDSYQEHTPQPRPDSELSGIQNDGTPSDSRRALFTGTLFVFCDRLTFDENRVRVDAGRARRRS
jgi:hypothetical protein